MRKCLNSRGSSGNWTEEVVLWNEVLPDIQLSDDGIESSDDSSDSWYSILSE